MSEQGHKDLIDEVLADLEAEQDKHPEIFYELRSEDSRLRVDLGDMSSAGLLKEKPEPSDYAELWERAAWTADWLSGQLCATFHVWQVRVYATVMGREKRREESYVVTACGGSRHWAPGSGLMPGPLHQIGSGGFCWDCMKSDPDLDVPGRGLVRHPVTPGELGKCSYACFVCGVDAGDPGAEHEGVTHLVIWGEATHPRCDSCGQGFRYATPEGIDYEPHRADCPVSS